MRALLLQHVDGLHEGAHDVAAGQGTHKLAVARKLIVTGRSIFRISQAISQVTATDLPAKAMP